MQNRYLKIAGVALIVLACFYTLQYIATAVHYTCMDPKEDCPPPIYGAGEIVYRTFVQPPWLMTAPVAPVFDAKDVITDEETGFNSSEATERYAARVDRVDVVFEQKDYQQYRLITNGAVREGELNTERGFEDDIDATVFVLDWKRPEGEQIRYVRLLKDPTHIYMLDGDQKILKGSALTLQP